MVGVWQEDGSEEEAVAAVGLEDCAEQGGDGGPWGCVEAVGLVAVEVPVDVHELVVVFHEGGEDVLGLVGVCVDEGVEAVGTLLHEGPFVVDGDGAVAVDLGGAVVDG